MNKVEHGSGKAMLSGIYYYIQNACIGTIRARKLDGSGDQKCMDTKGHKGQMDMGTRRAERVEGHGSRREWGLKYDMNPKELEEKCKEMSMQQLFETNVFYGLDDS